MKVSKKKLKPKQNQSPQPYLLGVLLFLLPLLFFTDLMTGSVWISFSDILGFFLAQSPVNETTENILMKIRLPRALTAVCAGSALSVCGLILQTLFRNPLAGPSILGITSGASLGVGLLLLSFQSSFGVYAFAQWSGMGSWLLILAAFLGSALVLALLLLFSLRVRDNILILIVGMMIGSLTTSLITVWQYFSNPESIRDYLVWTFGSLGGVNMEQIGVLSIVVLFGLLASFLISKYLNVLLLGENYALSMGLKIQQSRIIIILITSLLAGSVTAFAGPIGFIGIAVPHICRTTLNTGDHRRLIPATILTGAAVLLFCDLVSKFAGGQASLPINAVTSLVGAPVVIWIVLRSKNLRSGF